MRMYELGDGMTGLGPISTTIAFPRRPPAHDTRTEVSGTLGSLATLSEW